jgi:hypothetical protein
LILFDRVRDIAVFRDGEPNSIALIISTRKDKAGFESLDSVSYFEMKHIAIRIDLKIHSVEQYLYEIFKDEETIKFPTTEFMDRLKTYLTSPYIIGVSIISFTQKPIASIDNLISDISIALLATAISHEYSSSELFTDSGSV